MNIDIDRLSKTECLCMINLLKRGRQSLLATVKLINDRERLNGLKSFLALPLGYVVKKSTDILLYDEGLSLKHLYLSQQNTPLLLVYLNYPYSTLDILLPSI